MTRAIKASEFKAKCLGLMDEVAETGETIIVTKNGHPVVEVRPCESKAKKKLFGLLKGQVKITGDIISPIDVEWEAMK